MSNSLFRLDLLIYGISNIKYPLEDDLFDINMLDLNHTAPSGKTKKMHRKAVSR
jgi:hypothetical protein